MFRKSRVKQPFIILSMCYGGKRQPALYSTTFYLASNVIYSGSGGSDGPINRANISSLKILRMEVTR
jgi:hypothetical protein